MSITERDGAAAVEMVYVLLILIAFASLILRFSLFAGRIHTISIARQNGIVGQSIGVDSE